MTSREWSQLTPEEQAIHRAVWNEALSNPEFVAALEEGEADFRAGRVHKWSDVKARLALGRQEVASDLEVLA